MPIDLAKLWRAMASSPNKEVKWGNLGFVPKDTCRWAFIGISPTDARTLKEARWNPDNVHLWGPFNNWTPETATNWKSNGYTPDEILDGSRPLHRQSKSLTLDNHKITLDQWEIWRHITSLADTAIRIKQGFTPSTAEQWISQKIALSEATFIKGKLFPEETAVWLQEGIKVEQILIWKSMLPDPEAAGTFRKAGFTPGKATEWYDMGATAEEATVFIDGGWSPITVINWLHRNHLKYEDINKYIHSTISPDAAVTWKSKNFTATEAIQWAFILVHVDLAKSLKEMKIHA
ncbi:hypothetical protein DSO57_1011731 [Entomophthora muscae]|uniref:Uncharacterized protein n=1 Tax=Entomophthora muscae TaxID=34485 RepID=A0ACC2T6M9_9FUNG|nr:hypothetical protein DSO57_1011731 [Entomophthora muscae]